MLPRLNNLCDIYSVSKNFRGEFIKTLIFNNVRCRFSQKSSKIESNEGQLNTFSLTGWINSGYNVDKGQVIYFENKYWLIESATITKNLSGKDIFQYLVGREFYVEN